LNKINVTDDDIPKLILYLY